MRVVIQRVLRASVSVNSQLVSSIDRGLLVLLGITHTDTPLDIDYLAKKVLQVKFWRSEDDKPWQKSLVEMDYSVIVVSQFTLYHQLKGNKPGFNQAMPGEDALKMYNQFLETMKNMYKPDRVFPGAFGEYMNIEMVGDGPVTLTIESVKDEKAIKKQENLQKRADKQKQIQEMKKAKASGEKEQEEEKNQVEEEKDNQQEEVIQKQGE